MHKLFETLESKGFVSGNEIQNIYDLSDKNLLVLYEELYSSIFEAQYDNLDSSDNKPVLDPFSFMASASIRADSGCFEPECRLRKLDFLARFTALYANSVTVPLSLEHPDKVSETDVARDPLFRSLMSLFMLRPLIEQGFVRPVTMRTTHCEHVNELINEMRNVVHSVADWGAKKFANDFRVSYQLPEKAPRGRSTVYIDGPEEFLEHGSLVAIFDESSSWRAKSWKYDKEGKVELKGRKKVLFIERIFNTIANDTTFYMAYGQHQRSRLLTDRAGDTFLLDWFTEDDRLQTSSQAMQFLSHSLPILADIPLPTLIKIRREERESFESYRRAITALTSEVLKETVELTEVDAREVFKTKLEPQIEKIKAEANAEQSKQTKRISLGLTSLAAGVMIGAWGGLPLLAQGAIAGAAAAVGTGLLSKAAQSACDHGADIRKENDLYFLLRLIEE